MIEDKRARANIRMSQKIYDFYKAMAKDLGISLSSAFVIGLNEYMKQQIATDNMPELMELYRKDIESRDK